MRFHEEQDIKNKAKNSISELQKQIDGRVFVDTPLINLLEKLKSKLEGTGPIKLELELLEICHIGVLDYKKNTQMHLKESRIGEIDETHLHHVIGFLRDQLDKFFKPVELTSVNQAKQALESSMLNSESQKKIMDALEAVYDTPYRHTRLNALIILRDVCLTRATNRIAAQLAKTAHEMIKLIMNARSDYELKRLMTVRSTLIKYKPDFVTLPPKKSPMGELLRDLYFFETRSGTVKQECLELIVSKSLFPLNEECKNREAPFPVRTFQNLDDPKKARRVYLTLMIGYFLRAQAMGDIRPLNARDSAKDAEREKFEFSQAELEKMRLYPNSANRMFLKLEHIGEGRDMTLRFYPYTTHLMEINNIISDRGMVVMTPTGSLYTATTTSKVVHSSLAHNAYFAGYMQTYYGRWAEIGTISGNFRTTAQNARNFFKIIYDKWGIVDNNLNPKFYLDYRHSSHLINYAFEENKEKIYELIYRRPYTENHLERTFFRKAKFQMNRWAVNTENYLERNLPNNQLPRHKIHFDYLVQHSPEICAALELLLEFEDHTEEYLEQKSIVESTIIQELYSFWRVTIPSHIMLKLVKTKTPKLNENLQPINYGFNYKLVRRIPTYATSPNFIQNYYYSLQFERIVDSTFKQFKAYTFIPNHCPKTRFPDFEVGDYFVSHMLNYRERMHNQRLIKQTRNTAKMCDFFNAKTNINRAKTKGQKWLEGVLLNKYIGVLISSVLLAIFCPIAFVLILNAYTLSTIGIVLLTSNLMAIFACAQSRDDNIVIGYITNFYSTALIFLLMLLATPLSTPIALSLVLTSFGMFFLALPVAALHLVINAVLDISQENRLVTKIYDAKNDTLVKKIYSSGDTAKEETLANNNIYRDTYHLFGQERETYTNDLVDGELLEEVEQKYAPGFASRHAHDPRLSENRIPSLTEMLDGAPLLFNFNTPTKSVMCGGMKELQPIQTPSVAKSLVF